MKKTVETLEQKQGAWAVLDSVGWRILRNETGGYANHPDWLYWHGVAVWPEPCVSPRGVHWAVVVADFGAHHTDAGLPVRCLLVSANSPEDIPSGDDHDPRGYGCGTHWTPLTELAGMGAIWIRGLWDDFRQVLKEGASRFDRATHDAMRAHAPGGTFAELLAEWAFGEPGPNQFIRQLNGISAALPDEVEAAIQAAADYPGGHVWATRSRADARTWMYGHALREAAPDPLHWPPWEAKGRRIAAPWERAPKPMPAPVQMTLFDEVMG